MSTHFDVLVIGGGASGMMAAGRAAERGRKVLLLEKNKQLGVKLAMTGGGRCNICNAEEDIHRLLANYGLAKKFLYSSFSQFAVADTFDFFASHKLPLKVEGEKRAFPKTEQASDVVRVLKSYLDKGGVEIRMNSEVQGCIVKGKSVVGVNVGGKMLSAKSIILATGGKSHPETGSTGDGFRWLSTLHHKVKEPTPSIVPLAVQENWVKSLAGVVIDNVQVKFFANGKKRLAVKGKMLCTHFGISGPMILNSAKKVGDMFNEGAVTATIDLFPQLDLGALDTYVTEIFYKNSNRELKNVMKLIVPKGTSTAILSLFPQLELEKKVNSVYKAERKIIVNTLKALPITISGLMGYERAVVTDGGLEFSEVEGKTMRSRKYANLFITGDLLHIARSSGGFSLQLCWTTGWVAGNNA